MNEEQSAAVASTAPNKIIIAGPGSGKTRVLVAAVNECIKSATDPGRIVVLTYTNAAAGELVARLYEGEREADAQRIGYVGTLHGWIARLLGRPHVRALIGLELAPVIIDEDTADGLLDAVKKKMGYKGTKKAIGEAFKLYPQRSEPATPAELVVAEYRDQLKRTGMFDFNTLLHTGVELMRKIPAAALNVHHLFVDEVQDSSQHDWDIYDHAPVRTRFMVGDTDQSIMGFRGGKVDLMLAHCERQDWKVFTLERNYRSDAMICDAAMRVIAHNKNRYGKATFADSKKSGTVNVAVCSERFIEYSHALTVLKKKEGSRAVLLRTNHQVDGWAELLTESGIPVARRAERVFPPDWKVARLLLSVFANPMNDEVMTMYLAEMGHSAKEMATRRLKASEEGESLAKHWGLNVEGGTFTPHYAAEMLHANGRSAESAEVVHSLAKLLPARATMTDLLVSVSNEDARREMVGDLAGVHVLTMHGAKGLEFDSVLIPETDESVTSTHIITEEERRLFFVAMTRARHDLYITGATKGVGRDGDVEARKPLVFIQEIGGCSQPDVN